MGRLRGNPIKHVLLARDLARRTFLSCTFGARWNSLLSGAFHLTTDFENTLTACNRWNYVCRCPFVCLFLCLSICHCGGCDKIRSFLKHPVLRKYFWFLLKDCPNSCIILHKTQFRGIAAHWIRFPSQNLDGLSWHENLQFDNNIIE